MDKEFFFKCEESGLEFYNCKLCNFKTNLRFLFCRHFQNFHIKNKKNVSISGKCYLCENCNFSTFSLLLFFKHQLAYQKTTKKKKQLLDNYQCTYCSYKTTYNFVLQQHIIRKHTAPEKIKWFNCDKCDYKGKLKLDLRKHVKIHKTEKEISFFYCDHCKYKSKWKYDVKQHILAKHTANVSKYECNSCNYKTVRKGRLKSHIIRMHTASDKIEWYQCKDCVYRSKIKAELKQHVEVHKQLFSCDQCKFKTKIQGCFEKHILTKHRTDCECKICNYKTSQKEHLMVHMKRYHTASQSIPWYLCEDCTYMSQIKDKYLQHVESEHGTRKFNKM